MSVSRPQRWERAPLPFDTSTGWVYWFIFMVLSVGSTHLRHLRHLRFFFAYFKVKCRKCRRLSKIIFRHLIYSFYYIYIAKSEVSQVSKGGYLDDKFCHYKRGGLLHSFSIYNAVGPKSAYVGAKSLSVEAKFSGVER
jgi:hypothetical protein